ncbi:MAG: hypothetical protein J5J06_03610 [Phycisphaerae bacterium]|nr:hypothetical protein [Phycisphaerae bacterium]
MSRTPNKLSYVGSVAVALVFVLFLATSGGCASTYPKRNPVGENFPSVVGESLAKERTAIPESFRGRPAVLLIGFKQSAQFDIDRWLMGLLQAEVDARIVEVPTIPAIVPTMFSGWIDEGMRGGIPREDWPAVVTLYGSAAHPVAKLTGTKQGQVARVIVLDAEGKIVWFDDEGYAPRKAMQVAEVVERLDG